MSFFHQVFELLRNELGVVLSSTLARLLLAGSVTSLGATEQE